MTLSGPLFRRTLLFLTLAEIFSLFGYLFPTMNTVGFFVLSFLALLLTIAKLEYGVFLVLAELFTGSKGFLFFYEIDGTILSLRVALWVIVLGVWSARFVVDRLQKKPLELWWRSSMIRWYVLLAVVVFLGILNGVIQGNTFQDIVLDANAWLYFFLLFPFLSTIKTREDVSRVLTILVASTLFTSLKALFFLFVFAHDPLRTIYGPLYRWLRNTGGGEATAVTLTFTRVFLQSQIYTLIAFFVLLVDHVKRQRTLRSWTILSLLFASIVLSFSRSFWIGGIAALAVFLLIVGWKKFGDLLVVGVASVAVLFLILYFPYPKSLGGDFLFLFEKRVTETEESGISSRWNLLPPLWEKIGESPIVGKGFGTTVTYQSNDPRIVQSTARGNNFYTTYAFEWGYLDIWLKIGLFGLLIYLALIWNIIKKIHVSRFMFHDSGLLLGLLALLVTSIFSPYLNHPLGIGYLLLLTAFAHICDKGVQKT